VRGDRTLLLLKEGYRFLTSRIPASGWWETRLMLRKAVCIGGGDAPEVLYAPGRFTRRGAMPPHSLRLLQDVGSVNQLDGQAHAHRKAAFLALLEPEESRRLAAIFEAEWRAAEGGWRGRPVRLREEAERLLCIAACRWAGAPLTEEEIDRRTRELSLMVARAGSGNLARVLPALARRERHERWAQEIIRGVREGDIPAPTTAPIYRLAHWTDEKGERLSDKIAGVELVNLLRPTVAVGRYVAFAAHAMVETDGLRERLAAADDRLLESFAQEVRRAYPFFPAVGGRVVEPFEWNGRRFAVGEWVLADLHGANRDPQRWRAPERFEPERFLKGEDPARVAAQGAGDPVSSHRCPGETATVEIIKAATRRLVAAEWTVPPQDLSIDMTRMPTEPNDGMQLLFL